MTMTLTPGYYEQEQAVVDSLLEDGLDPDDVQLARLFTEVLWTFHWGRDGEEPLGEVSLSVGPTGRLNVVLDVWIADSESLDQDLKPAVVSMPVDRVQLPEEQIRQLVLHHLVHEADERLWFGADRPFYPHHDR